MLFRCTIATAAVFVAAITAQDGEQKTSPKSPPKPIAKSAPPAMPKYQVVNAVAGTIKKIDLEAKLITVDVPVLVKKSYRMVPQEFIIADDVNVRTLLLPPEQLDANNRRIPYTKAQKLELKGANPKLPGYKSDLEKLVQGQQVQVELSVRKATGKRDKSAAGEAPVATMIVIAVEDAKAENKKKK